MAVRDAASLLVGLLILCHTWRAWADVEVNMEDRVEVFRGDTARITCMFKSSEGIGAMVIQWFYVTPLGEKQRLYYQDSTAKVPERGTPFTDRISMNDAGAPGEVVLTINNVQLADELEFICLVKSLTEAAGEGRTRLKVFETPEFPTIQGVQTGISVNDEDLSRIGSCLVTNGYPKPNITWYRNNTPLRNIDNEVKVVPRSTSQSTGLYTVSSELNMKVVKANKDDQFYCEITYFVPGGTRMTETTRINITVLYPSTEVNIWVDSPKGKIKEGDTIKLHCQGNGHSNSELITISDEQTAESWETEMLELHNVTRLHSGLYQCGIVELETMEEIHGNTSVFVNYLDAAVVMPKDTILVTQGGELKATCNALSSLQTDTTWFKNGKVVAKGHSLMVKDATFDTAGKYVCVVTVPEIKGMQVSEVLHVKVQGPPKIMEQEHTDLEESVANTVDLSCNVRGFPAPSITWTTSDGKIIETATKEETEEGVHSVVSIEVTSDITAFCNATNEYGTDAVTFAIKAMINTTTPATTTITTTTTPTSTTTLSSTVKAKTAIPPKKIKQGEGKGVIIAVIIICILLLAILGSTLYFLYKKGKICGRSGKQDLTKEKSSKDNIVVEMKSDNTEEAVLLEVNGEKRPPSDQGGEYLDVQK